MLANQLESCGWAAMIWPLLSIRRLETLPLEIEPETTLILTSARALEALSGPLPAVASVFCVGSATAAAATARGFSDVVNVDADAEALFQRLVKLDGPFHHLRGEDARGDLIGRLNAAGKRAQDTVLYRAEQAQAAPDSVNEAILAGQLDAIALFSPRTAATFERLTRPEWGQALGNMTLFAISHAAAEPVMTLGFGEIIVAETPNGEAMRAAICSAAKNS